MISEKCMRLLNVQRQGCAGSDRWYETQENTRIINLEFQKPYKESLKHFRPYK